ncbi:MAG: hypothetical protein U5K76_07835 [Woeseiaceae bacterium]|nr:hypothetical protein [Woeseiaceae bacterium]
MAETGVLIGGQDCVIRTFATVPMPPGADDALFFEAWERVEAFVDAARPEFIILQCGADSLAGDPITTLAYTTAAHAHAARRLRPGRPACRRPPARDRRRRLQPRQSRPRLDRGRHRPDRIRLSRTAATRCRDARGPSCTIAARCDRVTRPSRPPHRPETRWMFADMTPLKEFDADLYAAIANEARRQEEHIELIASENYTSPRGPRGAGHRADQQVRRRAIPGKRYYGGCEYVDVAEDAGDRPRAKKLFGCRLRQRPAALRCRRPTPRPAWRCWNRATTSSA